MDQFLQMSFLQVNIVAVQILFAVKLHKIVIIEKKMLIQFFFLLLMLFAILTSSWADN